MTQAFQIIKTDINRHVVEGENWFAEHVGYSENVRQLRYAIDMLIDLSADCVNERRAAQAHILEHAYARARVDGLSELSDELVAFSGRLRELIQRHEAASAEAHAEYEAERKQWQIEGDVREVLWSRVLQGGLVKCTPCPVAGDKELPF